MRAQKMTSVLLVFILTLSTVFYLLSPAPADASGADLATLERDFADRVNAERREAGLDPLPVVVQQVRVGRDHSDAMASAGAIWHVDDKRLAAGWSW